MSSKEALVHLIRASVNGVIIDKTTAGGTEVCRVLFGYENLSVGEDEGRTGNALVFVTGTPAAKGEGWENTLDGDVDGWDGTTTTGGEVDAMDVARGIFRFADRKVITLLQPNAKGWRSFVEFGITMNKKSAVPTGSETDLAVVALPDDFALNKITPIR